MANIRFKNFLLAPVNIKHIRIQGKKLSIEMKSGNVFNNEYEDIEGAKEAYLDLGKQRDEALKEQIKEFSESKERKEDRKN